MIKESTEIDADLHSKLIFNKNAKAKILSTKDIGTTGCNMKKSF